MADQHQIMSIIATAIHDCSKDSAAAIGAEQSKQIAKCIFAALSDAGLHVVPAQKDRATGADA